MIDVFLFVLGMVFGSFGSVLIWRLQESLSWQDIKAILVGRSKCPKCWTTLQPKDLIPIFSFLSTKGKCRYCHKPISRVYPALEILSGLIFVFSYHWTIAHFGADPRWIVFWILINWLLLLLLFADILFFYLNNWIWLFAVLWILIWSFGLGLLNWQNVAIGWFIFWFVFWGVWLFGKFYLKIRYNLVNIEGIGEGDVLLAFVIWMLMGGLFPMQWDILILLPLAYLMLASLIWIVYALVSRLFKKTRQGKSIPFLPAMIVAFWLFMLYWEFILRMFQQIWKN